MNTSSAYLPAVRLVSSEEAAAGYLQAYDGEQREWTGVCADGWTTRSAHVVCRQLGHRLGEWTMGDEWQAR